MQTRPGKTQLTQALGKASLYLHREEAVRLASVVPVGLPTAELLSMDHITIEAPPPVRSAAASDSHGNTNPTVDCICERSMSHTLESSRNPMPSLRKNRLPQSQSLVPRRLGTTVLCLCAGNLLPALVAPAAPPVSFSAQLPLSCMKCPDHTGLLWLRAT